MNWFAIRVSYSRELALKAILDAEKIENFIPMRYEYVIKSGKRVRRLLPAIHNLVFVHSTRKRIDALKDELESSMPIRFIMNREFCRPVVIPDAQMRSFILVAVATRKLFFMWSLPNYIWQKGKKYVLRVVYSRG